MRIQRNKRHRKIVRFYSSCFGFRPPFKVLCDGTFLHRLATDGVDSESLEIALFKLLGAKVKPFTTRCAVAELKRLGKSYAEGLRLACKLATARCDHGTMSALECFAEVIGESNGEHFFLSTLDDNMNRKFGVLPGVPIIRSVKNTLILKGPSDSQHVFLRNQEEGRLHMSAREHKILERSLEESSDTPMTGSAAREFRRRNADRPHFRRNRAKGPNPLSCLKKKKKNVDQQQTKVHLKP